MGSVIISCLCIFDQTKTDCCHAYVIHSAVLIFSFIRSRMVFSSLANSFSIAMCHLMWPFSRKYGTVWYHPASSKPWYLTVLSFVNFQEKLTGTSSLLSACVKPACSACCVFGARCTFCVNRSENSRTIPRSHPPWPESWPAQEWGSTG
jgi:hypothetical protein